MIRLRAARTYVALLGLLAVLAVGYMWLAGGYGLGPGLEPNAERLACGDARSLSCRNMPELREWEENQENVRNEDGN